MILALAVAALVGGQAGVPTAACAAPTIVTDARVAGVRFFHREYDSDHGCGSPGLTYARLGTGRAWPADSEGETGLRDECPDQLTAAPQLPVVRRGDCVAYVARHASCGSGPSAAISVLDLRSGRRTDTPIGDDGVGSLVLGAGRRVAWITCPVRYTLGGRPAVYSVSRFYSQPGRNAQVLAGGPGCTDTPRRLDRGVAASPDR